MSAAPSAAPAATRHQLLPHGRRGAQVTVAAGLALLLGAAGWHWAPQAFLAAYLAAWWCWLGWVLGGLAQVWLHSLTGGDWGEAIRAPLLARGRLLWRHALLFAPVLLGMRTLYPWAAPDAGAWAGVLSTPQFKLAWLTPGGFVARSVVCLLLWSALGWCSSRPSLTRARGYAAGALALFGLSVSVAAVDWIMSLLPLWYSSVFGMLAGTVQMLGGMALAIAGCVRRTPAPQLLGDLGNLLLMYVLGCAYLEYMQFLIIWAGNLPHEIIWYLRRDTAAGRTLAVLLALLLFALPVLVLLQRRLKRSPRALGALAWLVLAMTLVHAWWLVLPSLTLPWRDWCIGLPSGTLALAATVWVSQGGGAGDG